MKRLSFGLALAIVLAGCASLPNSGGGGAGDQVAIDTHTLLGEIAFERQQADTAAREFLQAALLSPEPGLAERATRLAYQLEKTDVGLQAARRWNALAPSDWWPLWFAGVFELRSNRIDRATAQFTAFMDALGDKRSGFALMLQALGDEPYTDAATAIMRTLNDKFPGVPAGQYALARLALRSGDFGLALENAKAASDSDSNWLEAQLLYARSLLVAGRTDESLAMGARLAEQHSEVEVQLQYAELLLSAGKPRDAEARLDKILDTNPALPEAIRALAFLAMTEERYDEAKQRFGQLRQDPRYREEAFYYLGRIAETEMEWLQATRAYARVTEGTHAVEAQRRTARIMFAEQNDQEGAVRHLHDFAEANPRFASDMLVAQSQLLLQMQRPQEAMQLFDSALAENPDDPTLHAAHVQLYVILAQDASERGAFQEAETLLDQGLSRYADNSSLRYSQALLYEEEGKNRKAVDLLAALVKESPEDPALLNAYGYLLTDQFDRHKEARVYIQKALAKNPDSPAIIDSMGWVLFKLGDNAAAREYLERAYRLEQDPEIAAHLIEVRLALGDRPGAVELLKAALAQHPDDKHLQELGTRIGQ